MKRILSIIITVIMIFSMSACREKAILRPSISAGDDTQKEVNIDILETVDKEELLFSDLDLPAKNDAGFYELDTFMDISNKTGNYRYIMLDEIEGEKLNISAYPEEEFIKVYENKEIPEYLIESGFSKEVDVFKSIKNNAEVIFNTFTKTDGLITNMPSNGENTYLSFNNTGMPIKAFEYKLEEGTSLAEKLKQENLNLVLNNIKVKKYIGSSSMADDIWSIAVIADAEVTCLSNDGRFKDIAWIPKKGEFKNIEFAVLYMSYNMDGIHSILVNDILADVIE